jgi:Uma2 family endonuclease
MEAEKSQLLYYGLKIVAQNVSEEDYFANYEGHYEWVNGDVIEMSPVTDRNMLIQRFIMRMFDEYFYIRPIGDYRFDPFTMKLPNISNRQPDIQIILGDNLKNLKATHLYGAANIAIEIVSDATAAIDRGVKFKEFQKGGVLEYWIIDLEAREALFYRLNEEGKYIAQKLEKDSYQTSQMPDFVLHIPTLWESTLPDVGQIREADKKMLGQ